MPQLQHSRLPLQHCSKDPRDLKDCPRDLPSRRTATDVVRPRCRRRPRRPPRGRHCPPALEAPPPPARPARAKGRQDLALGASPPRRPRRPLTMAPEEVQRDRRLPTSILPMGSTSPCLLGRAFFWNHCPVRESRLGSGGWDTVQLSFLSFTLGFRHWTCDSGTVCTGSGLFLCTITPRTCNHTTIALSFPTAAMTLASALSLRTCPPPLLQDQVLTPNVKT